MGRAGDAKGKNLSTNFSGLRDILSLAACVLHAMNDVSKLSLGEFAGDLKTRLSDQISTCSQHLDNEGIKENEAIAESFYQLGLLVGAAESEIHSCYTTGREKRKKSQGGSHSKYQKHEPILLRHLAYYYLGIYKEHVDAVLTFNEETGEDMQSDTFRRFYSRFKRGEKLWISSSCEFTPEQMVAEIAKEIQKTL